MTTLVLCCGFEQAPREAWDLPGAHVVTLGPDEVRGRAAAHWTRAAEHFAGSHPGGFVGALGSAAPGFDRVVLVTRGRASAVVPVAWRSGARGQLAAVVAVDGCEGDPGAWAELLDSSQAAGGPVVGLWMVRYHRKADTRRMALAVELMERMSARHPLSVCRATEAPPGSGLDLAAAHQGEPRPGESVQVGEHTWAASPWRGSIGANGLLLACQEQGEASPQDAARYAASEGTGALLRGQIAPALRGGYLPRWRGGSRAPEPPPRRAARSAQGRPYPPPSPPVAPPPPVDVEDLLSSGLDRLETSLSAASILVPRIQAVIDDGRKVQEGGREVLRQLAGLFR